VLVSISSVGRFITTLRFRRPEAALDNAVYTKAVVAICELEVPNSAVGASGTPVNLGLSIDALSLIS